MKKLTALVIALAIPALAETVNEAVAFHTVPYKVRVYPKDDYIQQITAYQITIEYEHLGQKVTDVKTVRVVPQINQEFFREYKFDIPAGVTPKETVDRLVIAHRWTNSK